MNAKFQDDFLKAYAKLPVELQEMFDKKYEFMKHDLRHPSLRIKKMKGREGVWEGSVNTQYRFTFQFVEGGVLFRNIGNHDETLDNP
jgi:plasmid maintenance system killer protein